MTQVGIWERDEGIAAAVRAALGPEGPRILAGSHPAAWAEHGVDLLVLSPGATGWAGAGAIACRVALVPGGVAALSRSLKAGQVVTYGLSPRDGLALAGGGDEPPRLSVQQALVTLEGRTVERQILASDLPRGLEPLPWLAAAGTLLLLGETAFRFMNTGSQSDGH